MSDSKICMSPECCCGEVNRRDFLKLLGIGATAAIAGGLPVMAGPFTAADFEKMVPADKKLSPEWVHSLFARGDRTVYRGEDLRYIGMPIGGLCCGELYLGGDGKLWQWDIFNIPRGTGDGNYAHPPLPTFPIDQGFALRVTTGAASRNWTLDSAGFPGVTFSGEYPVAVVDYRDKECPVAASLEAFSPFIPLNADDSSLPVTVLRFKLTNTGADRIDVELAGWLENKVCLQSEKSATGLRQNRIIRDAQMVAVECSARPARRAENAVPRPTIVFEDFERDTYAPWKVEGDAFGTAPAHGAPTPEQRLKGFKGQGLANSWAKSDGPQGRLTSPDFKIERSFINFLIGGGNHPGETCINLVVNGKVVRTATGKDTDEMEPASWDVSELADQTAHIEIVDRNSGGWGHIDIDQVEFSDRSANNSGNLVGQPDFGTMALALLDPLAGDRSLACVPTEALDAIFPHDDALVYEKPFQEKLVGALSRKLSLDVGQAKTVTFVLSWHFPNLVVGGPHDGKGRYYATRFDSALAVARYLAENYDRLSGQTKLWHDTWYDSTLPYWFLDRTLLNISTLATSTAHRFADGRFYGWEGVGCCAGTCTHVWHYEHAMGRLFPELDILLRERVDFKQDVAMHPDGMIEHRGDCGAGQAVDGQAGTILRAYRDHQMSADDAFLKRNWASIKLAIEWLIGQDGNNDGVLEGAQHNTLDAEWYGPVAWLSGLYLAALRAGDAMGSEIGDDAFSTRCRSILEVGQKNFVGRMFNGEYFYQVADPARAKTVGCYNGCEIDQVFGQHWAFQVGLPRTLPEKETKEALASIWKYNFTPDVGPWREAHRPGRWYAMAGEAGTLMCSWPRGEEQRISTGYDYYFNECMNGFEHQVAGHMIWEGMVQEGLAVERSVHDRYHASKRNPWNEVECGDHYARSMASYGVFTAACGYEHHGPKGHLGFSPHLTPENFRAAFTAAEGWGTYSQASDGGKLKAAVDLRWGKLRLRTLAVALPEPKQPGAVTVSVNGKTVPSTYNVEGQRLAIALGEDVHLKADDKLEVLVG